MIVQSNSKLMIGTSNYNVFTESCIKYDYRIDIWIDKRNKVGLCGKYCTSSSINHQKKKNKSEVNRTAKKVISKLIMITWDKH